MATTIEQVRRQIQEYMRDGRVDDAEYNALLASSPDGNVDLGDGRIVALGTVLNPIRGMIQAGTPVDPLGGARAQLDGLVPQIEPLVAEIGRLEGTLQGLEAQIQAERDATRKNALWTEKKNALGQKEALQSQLQIIMRQASAAAGAMPEPVELSAEWYRAAGLPRPSDGSSNITLQMKAMTGGNGAGQGTQARAQGGMTFTAPALSSAQTAGPLFSTDTFMKANMMDDFVLNSFDDVMKNQNRGKQLMMLFYYFAKRAESGDMGQMYQFMKFITYIISKDKAKQQIDMGRKLIELQDESRRVTDTLLNQKTDANDPNSNNEFMKTMTWSKSQSDAIATSQKLIAQMMEEMAQVVETLTNVTKSALDSHKKIQSVTSSPR
ncbi:MAG: hypothetical protein HY465_05520 [Deltaproteobacteria bacterium]|nr:hypothetical protein [Deltaproteobacteria bacterium]